MADQLQLRGGTTTEHSTFTGALREVTVDTTKKTIVVHDNATAGGTPLAKENLSNVPAGTITSTMIADGTIATADIADGAVTSGKIADGTIVNADINAAAAIDLTKLANGALPTGITVSSANITDLTLATADIADGAVTSAKIADGTIVNADINAAAAIDKTKISGTAITAGDTGTVTSTMIADGTILNADINASAAIAGTKISPDFGSQNTTTTGTSTAASFIPTSSTAPSNGVYLPSANNVAISTNGTGRLFVDASGNVGVGATPSSYKLDVFGAARLNSSLDASLYLEEPSANSVRIKAGTSASFIGTTSNHPFYFVTNNTERMRLTSAGLLGLGTSSPSTLLHIQSTDPAFRFKRSDAAADAYGELTTDTSGLVTMKCDPANAAAGSGFRITVDNSEALRVDSSGRLGIGTTSPSNQLHLVGSATSNYIRLENSTGKRTFLAVEADRSVIYAQDNTSGASPLAFSIGETERGRWDSSGRLLVGTSSASDASKFVVQGQVGANAGQMSVRRNAVGADATILGSIDFDDSSASLGARIQAVGDAAWGTNDYPTRLVFSTTADGASSPTERMRIRSDGQTYWVSSDPTTTSYGTSIGRAGLPGLFETYRNAGATNSVVNAGGNAGQVVVYGDGDLENTNNRYTGFSDIRLKQNIEDSGSQWDDIKNVRVRKYELISDPSRRQIGVIAQELELTSPGLVVERGDDTTGETHKSVAYSVLYMKAVKALQEAMERIETLEAKVAALEAS